MLIAALATVCTLSATDPPVFPYRSPVLRELITESCTITQTPDPARFERDFTPKLAEGLGMPYDAWVANAKLQLKGLRGPALATRRRALGGEAWRAIKQSIRKFSLDRGFEFANVINTGERQCLLQSVLIASFLHDTGTPAGLVMVWENPRGQRSFLGHVAVMLPLDAERSIIVDASEKVPFVTSGGIFARTEGRYRFLRPAYNAAGEIVEVSGGRQRWPSKRVLPLTWGYTRSMFHFYRGERAPDGYAFTPSTDSGLETSRRWLRKSVAYDASNVLAWHVMAIVERKLGLATAAATAQRSARLTAAAGGWPQPGR
ncbi:MAG: hypothetical protein SFX74_06640 [Fimbriimonadaceae bacterium]|nr:hypothetical protein [Fimbriimonadaceae bacterium]